MVWQLLCFFVLTKGSTLVHFNLYVFLSIRQKEIEELNSIPDIDKINWFIEKTRKALDRCKNVHHNVEELRPLHFSHLNTWLNVFENFEKGKTDEI